MAPKMMVKAKEVATELSEKLHLMAIGGDEKLPDRWTSSPLGVCADVLMGQSPPGHSINETGDGLPFIQGSAEFQARHPAYYRYCEISSRIARPGDILFSVRAPVGDMNIADVTIGIGRGVASIRSKSMDQTFLYYSLIQARGRLQSQSQGSTFQAINRKDLEALAINLPPLPEQKAIAERLSAVDAVIEKTEAVVNQAKALKTGLMQTLLTRGTGDKKMVATESGEEIPEGWSRTTLKRVLLSMTNGLVYKGKFADDVGYKVSRIESIASGKINYQRVAQVGLTKEQKEKYRLNPGDILFSHINSVEHIGKTAYYDDAEELYHGMNLLRLVPDTSEINPRYLHYLLTLGSVRDYFRLRCKKSVNQASLNQGDVYSLEISVPPLPEQRAIADRLSAVDAVIEKNEAALVQLKTLKRGMMRDLLSGRVRVKMKGGKS